jgi:integrase
MNNKSHTRTTDKSNAEMLAALLDESGVDATTLAAALQSIATAARITAPPEEFRGKVYLNKELIYDDENAYIYQRNDTKKKYYYLRMWDRKSKKPFIKSLGTNDRARAVTSARIIYQEVKGKIEKGERIRNITTAEMIVIYLQGEELKITDVPRQGITAGRFRTKKYFLNYWLEYIAELGLEDAGIDKIKPYATRKFGYWLQKKPKDKKSNGKPRSIELINNAISEVGKMYKDIAVRERYISKDDVPEIDRLREQPDEEFKRDVYSLKEYKKLYKYMNDKYTRDKSVSADELAIRTIFAKLIGIMMNGGFRVKEVRGLMWKEVYENPHDDAEKRKENVLIKVRASNSKNGKSRVVAAPVKIRFDVIKKMQQALGNSVEPTDYIFANSKSKSGNPYTREAFANRLRKVLELSGLKEEFEREGKIINLYSCRHTYITWRLRYGDVPIHLLSTAVGSSVAQLMKSYARISVEKQADVLTRAQGFAKMAEVDLNIGLYNNNDD